MKTIVIALTLTFYWNIEFAQTKNEIEFISFFKMAISDAYKTNDTIKINCTQGNKFDSLKWEASFLCKKTKIKIELFSLSDFSNNNINKALKQLLDTSYTVNSSKIYEWIDNEKVFLSQKFTTVGGSQNYVIEYKKQKSHFRLPAHGLYIKDAILNNFKRRTL